MYKTECVVIKILQPTQRKCLFLETYQGLFGAAVQLGLDFAQENRTSSRNKIHEACYRKMRDLGLPSDYARMAVNQAVSMARCYWGMRKSKHFKKVSWPSINSNLAIGLGLNAYKLIRNGNRWVLRFSLGKRGHYLWLPLCVPQRYMDTLSLAYGDAQIFERNGKWYVKLPIRRPTSVPTVRDGTQLFGIDLGIAKTAVLVGPSVVKFFSGKATQDRRRQFQKYRQRMGRKGRLDKIKASKGKEANWAKDVNHKISRKVVDVVAGVPGGVIVMESLDGIRDRTRGSKRFNRMMGNWSFRQLKDMIIYKADRANVPVIFIDPRKTSQTCSKCGHATRSNRPDQAHFRCVKCGYQVNSDYNAAVNISRKGLYALCDAPPDTARASSEVPGNHLEQGCLMTGNPSTFRSL
jgi:putative transposase